MLSKFAVTALVGFVIWLVLFRTKGKPKKAKPAKLAYSLTKCKSCGAYRLPGARCDCDDA